MTTIKPVIGFALTGSFCTLDKALTLMQALQETYKLVPIVSERVLSTDTRFFKKEEVLSQIRSICNQDPISSICGAEPIGPQNKLDLLVVCPCTGNTLSKMALGITDSAVTMAVKAHRRNAKNVLVALSTNDALSGSAANLGILLEKKGFFFVPMKQDDPQKKPFSLQCDFTLVPEAIEAALGGKQLQPLFV